MNALVTGGTGFVGSQVVKRLLHDNHHVRIFSRKRSDFKGYACEGVDVACGDLEDPGTLITALDGIDVLYHAGEIKNTSIAASAKNVSLMQELLLNAGRLKDLRRIVLVSSITVAGIPSVLPADEDTPPRKILNDHYTDYKRRVEKLLVEKAGGIEYAIIRPAPVYGPGSRYLGRLISGLNRFGPLGIPFPGNAENLAPLIHVKDLASAIVAAGIEPAAAGKVFNITDGLRHSWREILDTILGLLGKRLRIIPVPKVLLQLPALPLDLLSGFFGVSLDPVSYISYFSEDLFFDNARAKDLLRWHPEYSLSDGMKDMIDLYKKGMSP